MTRIPGYSPIVRSHAGFSLVELLVVVSIIAVLAGLLLPAIRLVKGLAQTTSCASSMRQIGQCIVLFADENNGEMPGSAQSTGSVSWVDIVNNELLKGEGTQIPRMSAPKGTHLLCPLFQGLTYHRCYTYNGYAAGGNADHLAQTSQYGRVIQPASSRGPGYTYYCLGAPLSRFYNLSGKVLLRENERTSDHCGPSYPEGTMTLGDDPGYQEWCAFGGTWAFRHQGLTANFLFMDLHVEAQHPSGGLNRGSAYGFLP